MKNKIKHLMYKLLPIDQYLKITYWYYHKKKLNIKNPKRYTEKLFWLKKYYQNNQQDLLHTIYDKYQVRDYISKKLGTSEHLTTLCGVYDKASDINFDKLPENFILKITQGSGTNIVNRKNNPADEEISKERLSKWLVEARDLELTKKRYNEDSVLFDNNAKIICEELLMQDDGSIPNDVRFFCFNGKTKIFCVDFDSVNKDGEKKKGYLRNTYDLDGNLLDVNLGRKNDLESSFKPTFNIKKMQEIAEKLSEDFIFARIDMFVVDDKIFCGEITPIPQGGCGVVSPEIFDYKFGEFMELPIDQ